MNRRNFLHGSAASFAAARMIPSRALGANDRLRIGLIGCGGRGNALLEQLLRCAPSHNLEVSALCDVWSVNLERARASLTSRQPTEVRTFRRYGDLLSRNDIDAVVIATPDFAHTQILLDAARNRKDAYVEKPMSTVIDQANEAVRTVNQARTVVQVGVQRRSDPRHQAGAQLMRGNPIGTITEVEVAWHDAAPRWARDYSDVRAADVDWEQYLMFLPRETFRPERFRRWQFYKDFTQGTPALLGAHLIDVAVWFMEDPLPQTAVAHGGVYAWKDGREHPDTLECAIQYPKGFLLRYATRLGNKHAVPEVTFMGSRGTFDTMSWTASGEGGGEGAITQHVTIPAPAAVTGDEHMINWLECLRSRARTNAPVEVGYAHSVASMLCFQSWTTGRRQSFDAAARTIAAD